MCLDLIINLSNSVTNRSEYFMKICLFRKRSNPFMLEQILLNKMIKCPDTRSSTLKKNTCIIHSFCEKVVACFAVTTDASVNSLRANLYLKGICIMEDSLIFSQNIPDGYSNFDWKT